MREYTTDFLFSEPEDNRASSKVNLHPLLLYEDVLSEREKYILSMLYQKYTQDEIADDLGIHPSTVRKDLRSIREKVRRILG